MPNCKPEIEGLTYQLKTPLFLFKFFKIVFNYVLNINRSC